MSAGAAHTAGWPGFRHPVFVVAILRRLGISLLLLLIISALIFVACQELPGDVARAMLGQAATDSAVAAIRAKLGLGHPAWLRYLWWLGGALRGDFGASYTTGQRIAQRLGPRLINSLFLAVVAAVIAVPLSVGLGVVAAIRRDSWPDRLITTVTHASVTLPEFFVAYVLIFVVSVKLGWLDSSSSIDPSMSLGVRLQAVILPALTLVIAVTGHMTTIPAPPCGITHFDVTSVR